MVRVYANEYNQTMEFPKRVKRIDKIWRNYHLGAKLAFQQFDHFVLIFSPNYLTQNNLMVVKCLIFNNLEYVGTISSEKLLNLRPMFSKFYFI